MSHNGLNVLFGGSINYNLHVFLFMSNCFPIVGCLYFLILFTSIMTTEALAMVSLSEKTCPSLPVCLSVHN